MSKLKNHYYYLRHGQSQANMQGIIVSQLGHGADGYGLTDTGRKQVEASINQSGLGAATIILASPFARTKESAEIAQRLIGAKAYKIEGRLGERGFGRLELSSDQNYQNVWQRDKLNPHHTDHESESAQSVHDRVHRLIGELEARYQNQTILLVTHGDVIAALQQEFGQQAAYPDPGFLAALN